MNPAINSWVLFIHIYQPPTQTAATLDLVSTECYLPLLTYLTTVDYPFALNVTGSLLEQWQQQKYYDLIRLVRKLHTKRNITLTGSALTHPLLPLWPKDEIVHQITANTRGLRPYFGDQWRPRGLYLPEYAFAPRLIPILKQLGFNWTVIDEISLTRSAYLPAVRHQGCRFLVRERTLSRLLATDTQQFINRLQAATQPTVVALDGEVFGHFDPAALPRLTATLTQVGKHLVSPATLLSSTQPARLRAGTWETTAGDLARRQPFPLWNSRRNRLHRLMWQHLRHIYRVVSQSGGLASDVWVRHHFDNAQSSCYLWWANTRRTAGPFKMKIWNPDMIVAGLTEAIKAVRSDNRVDNTLKHQLETEHANLLKQVWQTHWRVSK